MADPVVAAQEGLRAQYNWGGMAGSNEPAGMENGCDALDDGRERCYTQDFLSNSWFEYGMTEGAQRLLKLWKDFGIKTSSYIVGLAAVNRPENIVALVENGHEPVCHGLTWSLPVFMEFEDEVAFHESAKTIIHDITGVNCTGYNAYWMADS